MNDGAGAIISVKAGILAMHSAFDVLAKACALSVDGMRRYHAVFAAREMKQDNRPYYRRFEKRGRY